MTAIENIAIIFAILVLVKMIFVLTVPMKWMKFGKWALKKSCLTTLVYLGLITWVGYYVLLDMTVVQVAAVATLVALVGGLGIIPYSNELLKTGEKMLKNKENMLKKNWLVIVIWVYFAIWVLISVFL
jgi:hypothetical protein